ncbi:thiamine pyrophosphate-dependent enzyme [Neobacillus niacini]|uniref:thiamine pyrophosphate-dependent enzyme n=1 Tax=Neobacillus niacini TaxID=86668 RepID=UPI002FFD915D
MKLVEKMSTYEDMVCPGITACSGCNVELSMRTALQIFGPNTIVAIPPGCMGGVQSVGWADKTGMKIPVFFPLLDNTASMLTGIKRHYERIGRDVNVVAFAGDGASVDAGFQALSGAAERGENIIYICYDNEGYMNTGFQRSSSTPFGSWTTTTPVGEASNGKSTHRKDMPMIMAMHDIAYMATASPAYMPDLIKKLEKAKTIKDGFVYIHIYNSCTTGWGYPSEKSIDIVRKGVQSRFTPIYEVDHGKFKLNVKVKNPIPLREYLTSMKKYSHLSDEQIDELQEYIDVKWDNLKTLCDVRS